MMRMMAIIVLLLFTGTVFSEAVKNIEEGISYEYRLFIDDTRSFSSEDENEYVQRDVSSTDESSSAWQGVIGTGNLTVEVENADFLSQCRAKWDGIQKKNETVEKKKSRSKKDTEKKKNHSPKVSIKWSTED